MEKLSINITETGEMGEKLTVINGIETGLNIIAQDILWKHKEKDIDNFINRFKFEKR
jgi:hypothetical protein